MIKHQRILTGTVVLVCFSTATFAQFLGAGMPVYDAGALVEAVAQTSKLVAQIQQMVKTYDKITAQYDHMTYQAQHLKNMAARYRTPSTYWRGLDSFSSVDRSGSGNTPRWIKTVNGGSDALDSWTRSVNSITLSGAILNARQKREMDAIEVQDASAITAMSMAGLIRSNGVRAEPILAALETDSLSANTDLNTMAAQQNKANAIAIIQAKQQSDANKLMVTANEIALLRMRQERDAAAVALQNDAAFKQEGKRNMEAMSAGFSDAMRNLRY
jgi:hypothetical protein